MRVIGVVLRMGFTMKKGIWGCLALLFLCGTQMPVHAEPETRISQFSGKPVPRFESLRYATVNGRTGPSLDHPIAWRYERSGLPVLILKESMDWRRVRDPAGAEVWVHARMLSSKQTGIVNRDAVLKRKMDADAEDIALIQAGVIVDILEGDKIWMKVRKNKMTGWVEHGDIWGQPISSLAKEFAD